MSYQVKCDRSDLGRAYHFAERNRIIYIHIQNNIERIVFEVLNANESLLNVINIKYIHTFGKRIRMRVWERARKKKPQQRLEINTHEIAEERLLPTLGNKPNIIDTFYLFRDVNHMPQHVHFFRWCFFSCFFVFFFYFNF